MLVLGFRVFEQGFPESGLKLEYICCRTLRPYDRVIKILFCDVAVGFD